VAGHVAFAIRATRTARLQAALGILPQNPLVGTGLARRARLRAMPMKIAIASDHAAVELKAQLRQWLDQQGHEVIDLGPDSAQSVDYPDYGYALAAALAEGRAERGVALCGSGIGISISVNRHPGVRCALVHEPLSATLAREHNDANCLALGARLIGPDMAKACLTAFLDTPFADAGDPAGRHRRRVDKLSHPPHFNQQGDPLE